MYSKTTFSGKLAKDAVKAQLLSLFRDRQNKQDCGALTGEEGQTTKHTVQPFLTVCGYWYEPPK